MRYAGIGVRADTGATANSLGRVFIGHVIV
jgi:hypothetical protein